MKATHYNRDVIWAPDDQSPAFLATIQAMWRGMETDGNLVPVIGSYKGESEFAFICSEKDYREVVAERRWTEEQESVMVISRCNKQYAILEYSNGELEGIGSVKEVSMREALEKDAWTYDPETSKWFITVDGNNDDVPPPEGWNADYTHLPKDARKFWLHKSGDFPVQPYHEGIDYSHVSDRWELCAVLPR